MTIVDMSKILKHFISSNQKWAVLIRWEDGGNRYSLPKPEDFEKLQFLKKGGDCDLSDLKVAVLCGGGLMLFETEDEAFDVFDLIPDAKTDKWQAELFNPNGISIMDNI